MNLIVDGRAWEIVSVENILRGSLGSTNISSSVRLTLRHDFGGSALPGGAMCDLYIPSRWREFTVDAATFEYALSTATEEARRIAAEEAAHGT